MNDTPLPASTFTIGRIQHRALGTLISLRPADGPGLRFTPAEASSLSLALVAVRNGISPEREIYMSPIASDAHFVGLVRDDGMRITIQDGTHTLDWHEVESLARGLAEAIG